MKKRPKLVSDKTPVACMGRKALLADLASVLAVADGCDPRADIDEVTHGKMAKRLSKGHLRQSALSLLKGLRSLEP